MTHAAAEPGCPYVGLVPFTAADERFFFGRERETRLVINNLFASRLTLLYGPSGVGKSSVLGAGVLAELARRAAREETPARAAVYLRHWQGDPLAAFAVAVRSAVREARPRATVAEPAAGEAAVDWLARLTGDLELELLVLFDQFEEYFVYHQEPGRVVRDPFARQLAAMVERPELPVSFLFGLRDDALARLDRFKALIPDLFDNYLRLESLSAAAATEAIERPLARWNEGLALREQVRLGRGLVDYVVAQVRRDEEGVGGRGRPAGAGAGIQAPLLQLVMKGDLREPAFGRRRPGSLLPSGRLPVAAGNRGLWLRISGAAARARLRRLPPADGGGMGVCRAGGHGDGSLHGGSDSGGSEQRTGARRHRVVWGKQRRGIPGWLRVFGLAGEAVAGEALRSSSGSGKGGKRLDAARHVGQCPRVGLG